MQTATATLLTPDGRRHPLRPGDVIGRSARAALHLNDPHVSELHAYLSLRADALVLLPLRGTLAVAGVGVSEVLLEGGLAIDLGAGPRVAVAEVHLPDQVMAVGIGAGALQMIASEHLSLQPEGRLQPGLTPEAIARLWTTGEAWFLDRGDGPEPVQPGWRGTIAGIALRLGTLPLSRAGVAPTAGRAEEPPLHVVARYDAVQLQHLGGEVALLSGLPARLVSELAAVGGGAHWETIARQLWRDVDDRGLLRDRWDKVLRSLRRKLAAASIREDLVRTSHGQCELVLRTHDSLELEV